MFRAVQVTASTVAAVAPSGASNAGPVADDLKGTKITFFHWRAEDKDVLADIIKDFTAKTGIEVEQSIKNSTDYQAQALQDILDGKPADVFTAFRGAQFFNMAKANGGSVFLDITNQPFVKNYNPSLIAPGSFDKKQLGLPYQLVFNMPVLTSSPPLRTGIPWVASECNVQGLTVHRADHFRLSSTSCHRMPCGSLKHSLQKKC